MAIRAAVPTGCRDSVLSNANTTVSAPYALTTLLPLGFNAATIDLTAHVATAAYLAGGMASANKVNAAAPLPRHITAADFASVFNYFKIGVPGAADALPAGADFVRQNWGTAPVGARAFILNVRLSTVLTPAASFLSGVLGGRPSTADTAALLLSRIASDMIAGNLTLEDQNYLTSLMVSVYTDITGKSSSRRRYMLATTLTFDQLKSIIAKVASTVSQSSAMLVQLDKQISAAAETGQTLDTAAVLTSAAQVSSVASSSMTQALTALAAAVSSGDLAAVDALTASFEASFSGTALRTAVESAAVNTADLVDAAPASSPEPSTVVDGIDTANSTEATGNEDEGNRSGMIAGAVVGSVCGAGLIAGVGVIVYHVTQRRKAANVTPKASGRVNGGTVKCLELACIDDYITVPADALSSLLSSLPMLQTFTLRSGLAEEGSPLAHAQVAASLASLSHLTALTLEDYGWLPCIQPGLTERLQELHLGGAASDAAPPCRTLLAAAVAGMPALRVLCLGRGACLGPAELKAVLDALQPSVRTFTAREVRLCHHADGPGAVTCELVGGELASVAIAQGRMGCKFHAADLAALLEAALLPCRALGPRLPSLSLDLRLTPGLHGEATAAAPAFGPGALDLLSRCDAVRLSALEANGCPPGAVLEVSRLLGTPDRLQCGVAVRLRAPASQHPAASGGLEGSCSDSSTSTGACAPREAPWVLRRAMQAMTWVGAHAGSEPEGPLGWPLGHLLLHGPALAQLTASPPALHAWAQQLNAELSSRHAPTGPSSAAPCSGHSTPQCGARPPRPPRVVGYQPLPALGAVTLACNREAQALGAALAAAVRETLAACSGACGGGISGAGVGASQPGLRVQPVRMWLSDAIGQVLGALWRGEEEGGPGPDEDALAPTQLVTATDLHRAHAVGMVAVTFVPLGVAREGNQDVHVEDLTALLEAALLPGRVLGPRLPLLSVPLTLFADEETSAALARLSPGIRRLADRCDKLHLFSLCVPRGGTVSLEDIMAIARVLGVPEELEWGEHPSLELLPPRSPAAAGTASRGSGSEARRLSSGSPALTPAQAAPRVVERAIQKTMGGPAVGSHLLLFGPAVSSRLVFPRELRGWVAELIAKAAESLQPQKARMKPIVRFRPVPSFGAVELSCRSDLAAAVAEAGRRAGAAVLTAGCSLETALAQVLQALWSGEEAGGPGADVGELERFRWLLETMEAAAALLPAVERL
ncbi:hypothetical protein HYH03_010134 [Edaphochlamys debaryana]|uniref:Uncharacterized protein n=1 Tax=Edaphochlamys debaryana TaxID=47281 RepID=A0A835XWN3_9CHLO|nr:hypothetical protein HYH03_010134 [Edaphochlamys debaryana]|eukprot:KAG2491566.1 hypothetical protein HYH03_010134 [Edaphochlamys debaryana]